MNVITIIPARGGSKGLKNKNLLKVGRYKLIERAVITSNQLSFIDKTFVTSDSSSILNVAKKMHAEIIVRPKYLSKSNSSSESAILHALKTIKQLYGIMPKYVCFLQCTSPFILKKDILGAYNKLIKLKYDCIFSVTKNHNNLWNITNNKIKPVNHNPQKRMMRQDYNKQFNENGAFYIFNTKKFIKYKTRFCNNSSYYETGYFTNIEIDSLKDLKIANFISKEFKI